MFIPTILRDKDLLVDLSSRKNDIIPNIPETHNNMLPAFPNLSSELVIPGVVISLHMIIVMINSRIPMFCFNI